ncbi:hypothetical protein [Deinococcus sp.]|uniref:hypothetical protein n=1 Tax=Deinococcus sp. TaxID=47478 RepID=UPI00286E0CA2|nr:hypothetical protein [Deinococcus sp.]
MKVIGPYVISAVPHLYREVMNGGTGDGQGSPPEPAPAALPRARHQSGQNTRNQTTRAGGRKGGRPDASANLVLSALNALPMHGIDRLTGMPVLLHRLNEFVVPAVLPGSPYLLPVTEVDIWDAHPYAVTELPPAAVLATHPATAALGVLRALTALHGAGQVHGGLNAGQFWQVGREVRLAGAGLPWQPGAEADADMHALGQALDTLGARPAVLLNLEQMTARQALSALEGAMQQPEPVSAVRAGVQPEQDDAVPLTLPQPELTRADLGWNGATDAQGTLSGPGSSAGVPAAGVTWNRRKTDRAVQVTVNQAAVSQTMPDSRPEEAVVVEVAARTVIAPVPIIPVPALIAPLPVAPLPGPTLESGSEPTPAPLPYRSADDVIVIGEALQAQTIQADSTVNSEDSTVNSEVVRVDTVHTDASDGDVPGEKTAADASRGPGTRSGPAPGSALAPIRIGFSDLPETDLPTDLLGDLPEPLPDRTPQRSGPVAPGLQPGRPTRFTPAHASGGAQMAPDASRSGKSDFSALNPAQSVAARRGQASPEATGPSPAIRMQPLRIGWEEDHSWRVVKSGPEKRGALTRRFPLWVMALVLLALLAGAAFWLLGRAGSPSTACCSVNFTVSGSGQSVQVTLAKAPPGSPLQPGAVIGTAPGLLNFPDVAGEYTLKFSAQGHSALTAAVSVPSSQPFAIMLK